MTIQIIDLDNCISDDSWRQQYIDKTYKKDPYIAYHSLCVNDKPANLDKIDMGESTWIITGRPAYFRELTMYWLAKNVPLKRFELYMRPANLRFLPSPELKTRLYHVAHNLSEFSSEPIRIAYDDREDVLKAYEELFIPTQRLFINEYSHY